MLLDITRAFYNRLPAPLDNCLYGIFLNVLVPTVAVGERDYNLGEFNMKLDLNESPMMVDRGFRTYELIISNLISNHITQGDIYVDIGSNKGYHALEAATIVGSDGQVCCFEPNPNNVEDLHYNIRINSLYNIKTYEKAMYSSSGTSKFTTGAKSGWGSVSDDGEIAVEMITFDAFLQEEGLAPTDIDFIKIDVEGSEAEVVTGMDEFLRRAEGCTILIEIHSRKQKSKVLQYLDDDRLSISEINGYLMLKI